MDRLAAAAVARLRAAGRIVRSWWAWLVPWLRTVTIGGWRPDKTQVAAAVGAVMVVGVIVGGVGFVVHTNKGTSPAQERVSLAVAALATDSNAGQVLMSRSVSGAAGRAREAHVHDAWGALAYAEAVLVSSPHAGDVPRAQLDAVSDTLAKVLAEPRTSPYRVSQVTAMLAQPQSGVLDAEAQWQAAEAARVAAEQEAAAAQAPGRVRAGGVRGGEVVPPPPTPAQPTVPAAGKTCSAAGLNGTGSSPSEIGDAINAYRATYGLPELSVIASPTLASHAVTMANAGGIWHSGADNIVGCVPTVSASSLVVAWSRSAPHNAQMLRSDIRSVHVGGAVRDGWLYGAASFL